MSGMSQQRILVGVEVQSSKGSSKAVCLCVFASSTCRQFAVVIILVSTIEQQVFSRFVFCVPVMLFQIFGCRYFCLLLYIGAAVLYFQSRFCSPSLVMLLLLLHLLVCSMFSSCVACYKMDFQNCNVRIHPEVEE